MNRSNDDLILTQSVKYSLCSDVIMTLLCACRLVKKISKQRISEEWDKMDQHGSAGNKSLAKTSYSLCLHEIDTQSTLFIRQNSKLITSERISSAARTERCFLNCEEYLFQASCLFSMADFQVNYRARQIYKNISQIYKNISMLFLFPVARDLLFTNI